jgi:hypothetical protein
LAVKAGLGTWTWDVGLSREAPARTCAGGRCHSLLFSSKAHRPSVGCSCCSSRFSITSSLSQAAGASHVHSFPARSSSESSFPSLLHPIWVTFDHPPARLDTSPSIALLQSLSKLKTKAFPTLSLVTLDRVRNFPRGSGRTASTNLVSQSYSAMAQDDKRSMTARSGDANQRKALVISPNLHYAD